MLARRRAGDGLALWKLGATAAVLPELEALRGVEQNRYHHLDVLDHTLEVLDPPSSRATPARRSAPSTARRSPRCSRSRWPTR